MRHCKSRTFRQFVLHRAEMRDLDQAAKDAGVCLVNEIGLDPGIDHLMAHKLVEFIVPRMHLIRQMNWDLFHTAVVYQRFRIPFDTNLAGLHWAC